MRGLEYPHQLEITVDGERVHLASFGGERRNRRLERQPDDDRRRGRRALARCACRSRPARTRSPWRSSRSRTARSTRRLQSCSRAAPPTRSTSAGLSAHRHVHRRPGRSTRPAPATRRAAARIFICRPPRPADETPCARRILSTLGAPRLSRRLATDADLQRAAGLLSARPPRAGSFESGIDVALRRILASPKFVFRVERDPATARAGSVYPRQRSRAGVAPVVLPLEQHSRRRAARRGGQGTAAARRRCSSSRCGACWPIRRSQALVDNFAGQWLLPAQPAEHDAELERVPRLRRQPAPGVPARDRSCSSTASCARTATSLDLLTADYTFVNERLAKHYGIPNVYGSQFRRVTLTDERATGCSARAAS